MIKSKKNKMGRACSQNGRRRSAIKILTDKPTGKKIFRKARCRWEDYIRMDLKEMGVNTRNQIISAHDRNYWRGIEPQDSISHRFS